MKRGKLDKYTLIYKEQKEKEIGSKIIATLGIELLIILTTMSNKKEKIQFSRKRKSHSTGITYKPIW